KRLLVVGHRCVGFPALHVGESLLRGITDRGIVIREGIGKVALQPIQDGACAVGQGICRIALDGLTVIGDGAIVIALPTVVGVTAVVEEERIARSYLNGGVEIGDGTVVLAFFAISHSAPVVDVWIVRLEL